MIRELGVNTNVLPVPVKIRVNRVWVDKDEPFAAPIKIVNC